MRRRSIQLLLAGFATLAAACGDPEPAAPASGPTETTPAALPETGFPVVTGFVDGGEVDYLLQEVSDPDVAQLMTDVTGGFPVPVVPSLADVPPGSLATLYLFMNGVEGPNPFGFQPNVLDSTLGDPDYSPLWLHTFVTWNEGATPRVLMSEEEIVQAEADGELTLEGSDLVINCPVIPA